MYTPENFRKTEPTEIFSFMEKYAFATLISLRDGKPFISHLPLLVTKNETGEMKLLGHMARANPQWKDFLAADSVGPVETAAEATSTTLPEVTAIFQGPHTYITPRWYVEKLNVPTWNYASVHAYGIPKILKDPREVHALLGRTVDVFEAAYLSPGTEPWKFELPETFTEGLEKAIVAFEIPINRFEAKYKLSQNRAPEDQAGVLRGLEERRDEMSKEVLELMKSVLK